MATTALSQNQPRRRPLTYGKKPSRLPQQHSFTPEAELQGQRTPAKTPSKLRKLGRDPAKSSSLRQPTGAVGENSTVYDILSSEDDLPVSPTPRPARKDDNVFKWGTRVCTPMSPHPWSRTSSADSRKRKRSTSTSDRSRQSFSSLATNDQVADQLLREWAAADARPSPTPNHESQQQAGDLVDVDVTPVCADCYPPMQVMGCRSKAKMERHQTQVSQPKISQPRAGRAEKNDGRTYTNPSRVGPPKERPHTPPRRPCIKPSPPLPQTPPDSGSSPDNLPHGGKAITTPRQARLWDTLLQQGQESISVSRMKSLKVLQPPSESQEATKNPPRLRLIDSLMAGTESSPPDPEASQNNLDIESEASSESNVIQAPETVVESQATSVSVIGPKITYAQQRSHLSTNVENMDSLLDQSLDLGLSPAVSVSTKTGTGSQIPPDKDEDDGDDANGRMRSIHELRASGNNRRVDYEIEKLLEDISDRKKPAISSKRSALLELVHKLAQPAFKNRILQSPLGNQIFEVCHAEKDSITGTAISAAIAFVQQNVEGKLSMPVVRDSLASRSLQNMLHLARDIRAIARDRQTNMSKVAQVGVAEFESTVKESSIWADKKPKVVTPRLVALKALDLLVRRHREAGNTEGLVDEHTVRILLDIMGQSCEALKKEARAPGGDAWLHLELSISILESYSIAPALAAGSSLWNEEVLARSVDCMGSVLGLTQLQIQTIRPLLLRLSLNLANGNEPASDCFANPNFLCKVVSLVTTGFRSLELEELEEHQQQQEIDQLLLALGSLFNLAEMSDRTRQVVVDECRGDVGEMIDIFSNSRSKYAEADSMAGSQMNVALGYLAVLLANLCRNREAKGRIQSKLPGCRLNSLVEAIDEFITFHKEVDRREGAGSDVWTSFTSRLQAVAEVLKALDAEERR